MLEKSNKKKHKNMDTQTKTQLMQPDEKSRGCVCSPGRGSGNYALFYHRRVTFLTWDSRAM